MSSTSGSIIGIIGAGTMGSGIAQVAAAAGHPALLLDSDEAAIKRAKHNINSSFARLIEKGKLTEAQAAAVTARISYPSSLTEFHNCTLVIEAVVENAAVKQNLFAELENIVDEECILATNTSSLSITSLASACNHRNRVIGIHFFNPAPLMPLVEIIGGLDTGKDVINKAKTLVEQWGKTPVLAKDTPGFIVNRIARPFYGEAIRIYEEGIADFATIDRAMKQGGFKMGPFELMDFIGNDINYAVTETVWKQTFYEPRYKPSLTQQRLVEAKRFGKKSGRGYYDYSEKAVKPKPVTDKVLSGKIFIRILSMLINEAVDALYMQVASKEDIDLAMTKGVNYPKGLLKWCDESGAQYILQVINGLREEYNEERYRPSVLLKKMAKENRKFYE